MSLNMEKVPFDKIRTRPSAAIVETMSQDTWQEDNFAPHSVLR